MKRFVAFFLVFAFSIIMPLTARAEFRKTKIAVFDFQLQGEGFETADMGKIVAEWLITALVKEGRFDVIERRLLEKILQEQKLGMSGIITEDSAVKLGKLLGAKIIISGSVMRFQKIIEVNSRIIEVESASIIAAESVKSTTTTRLEDLVIQMAKKINRDFPLEGYIVHRDEKKVLIDLGKRAGVKSDMQFIVFKEGNVIRHPKTGEVLDVQRIETGTIKVKCININTAEAEILSETTPGAIKYGKLVKSVIKPMSPIGRYAQPFDDTKSIYETADQKIQSKLAQVDTLLKEANKLKSAANPEWKTKNKQIFRLLKEALRIKRKSPEVYLYYAKAYYMAKNSIKAANKYLNRALSYRRNYVEAFMFRGDIYYDFAKNRAQKKSHKKKYGKPAYKAYESAAKATQDNNLKAMMYFKIGNIYFEFFEDGKKAKKWWQKAAEIAPKSTGANLANAKLRACQ